MKSTNGASRPNMPEDSPRHGGDIQSFCQQYGFAENEVLDLSTGISPWSWPVPEVPQSVWQSLPYGEFDSNTLNVSNERHSKLIEAASTYYQCSTRNLIPVAGSQMAIEALPRMVQINSSREFEPEVLIPMVGYAEHAFQWQRAGFKVSKYLHLDDLVSQLENGHAKYAVVINPNNPGTDQYSPDALLPLTRKLGDRGGFLIVDEAFADASPELSLVPYVSEEPLIVLRSVGKFFGLAGLRLGFIAVSETLVIRLKLEIGLWSVNSAAHWLGTHMLNDSVWVNEQKTRIQTKSSELCKWLQQRVPALQWKKCATFVSGFGSDQEVTRLATGFAQSGIIVRTFKGSNSILRLGLVGESGLERLQLALEKMEQKNEI